jgi:hypothetical protein
MVHTLTKPELLQLSDSAGRVSLGADQEWFRDPWQRRAGCGPTTAATLMAYAAQVTPSLANLSPKAPLTVENFLTYMEQVWPYVTPGARGLDRAESLVVGCRSFALSRGCRLAGDILEIPRRREDRPTLDRIQDFLAQALDQDRPVAFLNYSNGSLHNLDSWHWVPLISMTTGDNILLCTVLDGGTEKIVELSLWLETSLLGGALAALREDAPPEVSPNQPQNV